MLIKTILIDADGVIQYASEDWEVAFARCLNSDDAAQARNFTADIYDAETACLSRAEGFDEELRDVLRNWGKLEHKSAVLQAMLAICPHNDVQDVIRAVRAGGVKCYVASNQQAQRAKYMSTELGYASLFDGELYSCALGAAKPSKRYFQLALTAIGADGASTLFIDDRPENVKGAKQAGLHAFVYCPIPDDHKDAYGTGEDGICTSSSWSGWA